MNAPIRDLAVKMESQFDLLFGPKSSCHDVVSIDDVGFIGGDLEGRS